MKNAKRIAATIAMIGSLLCAGPVVADDGSRCLSPSNYLRGTGVVELTIAQETLFVKPIAVPGGCWVLVEIAKGQNVGKQFMINLEQVSKMTK